MDGTQAVQERRWYQEWVENGRPEHDCATEAVDFSGQPGGGVVCGVCGKAVVANG